MSMNSYVRSRKRVCEQSIEQRVQIIQQTLYGKGSEELAALWHHYFNFVLANVLISDRSLCAKQVHFEFLFNFFEDEKIKTTSFSFLYYISCHQGT